MVQQAIADGLARQDMSANTLWSEYILFLQKTKVYRPGVAG
jgi:hypothetical protein